MNAKCEECESDSARRERIAKEESKQTCNKQLSALWWRGWERETVRGAAEVEVPRVLRGRAVSCDDHM
jgi:hypothetical protein